MSRVVHKASFKKTIEVYVGFGQYALVTTPLCKPGTYYENKGFPRMARFWKDVTCKKCLKIKGKGNETRTI